MKIHARSTVGLIAAAILAAGLVTGTVGATAAPSNDDDSGRHPLKQATPQERAGGTDASVSAAAAPGDLVNEQLFVPISPCRVVDTRAGGGKLAANTTRSFYVSGSTGFAAQGGASAGCGIPVGATAAALSMTSTQPSAAGRIVAYPAGTATPASTLLSYAASGNTTSTPPVALRPGAAKQLAVKNFTASVHLVIDVLGYYVPQLYAWVDPHEDYYVGSRVLGVWEEETGVSSIEFDTDITYCTASATAAEPGFTAAVYLDGAAAWVYVSDTAGAPADAIVNVIVVC